MSNNVPYSKVIHVVQEIINYECDCNLHIAGFFGDPTRSNAGDGLSFVAHESASNFVSVSRFCYNSQSRKIQNCNLNFPRPKPQIAPSILHLQRTLATRARYAHTSLYAFAFPNTGLR